LQMLEIYSVFAEHHMALPVVKGKKSEGEKFPGAIDTYCIEGLMQDGKALQAGTSHFLGQNFAKAFDVQFAGKDGKLEYVWGTSWGVSTRLMGALIMAHSDDDGLVLPPKLAPIHVVIVPIFKSDEEFAKISAKVNEISAELRKHNVTVKFDNRDTHKPGFKFAEWELKGVPVRLAIGPRDLENGTVEVARRDTKEKKVMQMDTVAVDVLVLLDDIQKNIHQKALKFREGMTSQVDSFADFKKVMEEKGGFILAHWDGTKETEAAIKEETKATIRCIPLDAVEEAGVCVYSGKPSSRRVLFAQAY
jgi:prolyl-tRNA synthetase